MQTPQDLYRLYRADRCFLEIPQYHAERLPHLVRYTPELKAAGGIVVFANLKPEQAEQAIAEQIEYFTGMDIDFEWKLYSFDQPANLQELLEARNFRAGKVEAFMVYQMQQWQSAASDGKPWHIEQVSTPQGVADIVAIQQQLYPRDFGWLEQQMLAVLASRPETLSLYCAYAQGKPVGSGWTDFPEGSAIPELHGGAVVSQWRGQGVYRDLCSVRLAEIASRGSKLVAVDASPMSRPILERIGFTYVCATMPMHYTKQAAARMHH